MNISPQRWLRTGALALGALFLLMGEASAATESKEVKDVVVSKEATPEFRFDFGILGGAHFFTSKHSLGSYPGIDSTNPPTMPTGEPSSWEGISPKSSGVFGARLGLHFNRWIGVEAEVGMTPTKTHDGASALWVFGYRGNLILNLTDSYVFQPFVLVGMGALSSLNDNSSYSDHNDTWEFLHAGVGFKIGFTPWTGLRVDGRIMGPWTVLGFPKGDRMAAQGPDWEALGAIYLNFGEIERMQVTVIKESSGDRDGDGIPDNLDKCPDQPEDFDGFQDEDGCPDLDNDGDGIPDALDKCPNEPEDKDGFQDEDGCPDPDNDGDGIPDVLDKCPNEPEDKDGFQDEDGCPDPDNDGDGIPDVRDKCPNEPETFNNYQDEDGCPDEVPAEVKKFTGVIEGINFKTGSSEILAGSYVLLDRAVKVLQDYRDVNLEISGHTDSRGKADYNRDLSQRRADSVKTYFVQRGIASTRLQSIGYGPTRPIADNKTSSGRATNRRTEFRLINPSEK
jgi:OOP family OmpA-OmpF porin